MDREAWRAAIHGVAKLGEDDWVIIQYVHSLVVKAIKVMLLIIIKALPCIKYNAFI